MELLHLIDTTFIPSPPDWIKQNHFMLLLGFFSEATLFFPSWFITRINAEKYNVCVFIFIQGVPYIYIPPLKINLLFSWWKCFTSDLY